MFPSVRPTHFFLLTIFQLRQLVPFTTFVFLHIKIHLHFSFTLIQLNKTVAESDNENKELSWRRHVHTADAVYALNLYFNLNGRSFMLLLCYFDMSIFSILL
jgi:hypothetical protein